MKPLRISITCIFVCAGCSLRADILGGPSRAPPTVPLLLTQGDRVMAEDEAVAMGGHLVKIDDEAKQPCVVKLMNYNDRML